jgi:hypothetical protein
MQFGRPLCLLKCLERKSELKLCTEVLVYQCMITIFSQGFARITSLAHRLRQRKRMPTKLTRQKYVAY